MATLEECRQRLIEKHGRDTSVTLYVQTDGYITLTVHQHAGPGRLRRMEAGAFSHDVDQVGKSDLERIAMVCDRMLAMLEAGGPWESWDGEQAPAQEAV